MVGLGTIINVAGVIIGGLIGLLFGRFITQRFQDSLVTACGICVIFIGIGGAISEMLRYDGSSFSTAGTMMCIASIIGGAFIGELLNIEYYFEKFGEWLKVKSGSSGDTRFVDGFVTTSLTICIGAMAIIGSIQDGILGDYTTLEAKAVLDLIIVLVLTTTLGKGCIFSAIPVGIFQGSVTLLARVIKPLMTDAALANISLVGSILIFCVGVNLVWGKKVKVANLLPGIIIAVIWAFLPFA